ncbi:nucleic acid/nucleotide deaminase domain-containing protein [Aspergillus thermomutatus]|uniref:Fungal-type protein kinase domain-containing protein n=1 Tax=Aspergillus thermomutatus TaxID=41047 RepID=A0A397G1M0_ASPTH|nr:uncharacterized protein CDV56_101162 [Aspergillus thermomutatus]RHZ43196.1 hypothetical protein CDV56_101162 [Aspergillus thermomutatus]
MSAIVGFDHLGFLALSFLLHIYEAQQDPENVSGEDEEPDDENDSITLHELSTSYPKERQLAKFLDSIAETFSREKSIPRAGGQRHIRRRGNATGKGARQVSASGLVMANQQPTVYIAKNEGTDEEDKKEDKKLADTLTTWIRAIASTGKRPAIDKDKVWTELLSYYKQRLDVYAAQIESFSVAEITAAFVEGSNGVARAWELHSLSVEYKIDKSTEVLRRMVSIAYELRYEPNPATLSPRSRKGRNSICFLGRLRSAYETFKETAIQLQKSFAKLSIVCLQALDSMRFTRREVEERIQILARKEGKPQLKKKEIRKALGEKPEIRTHCHAEIQLLLHLESYTSPEEHPFPYLGCSKKTCWLCHQFLSRYKSKKTDKGNFYQTRGSHRKVYPLWHIRQPADPRMQFYLSTTLQDIQDLMNAKLPIVSHIQRPAQAESSANVTVAGGALKRRALAKQRMMESSRESKSSKDEMTILDDFVCSKECFRIPANGETPHFLSIDFYRSPQNYMGHEPPTWCIPDFSAYWSNFNFERVYRVFKLNKQEPGELNGEYVLYWCCNDGLQPNRCLMSLLGIESLRIDEYFWYGDVFITRFHEDDKTFEFSCEDVPRAFSGCKELLTNLIWSYWKSKEPKNAILEWQYLEAKQEKHNADKQIILGRMSRNEREILKQMPWMLEYLAITACDDDALVDASIRESKDHPGMAEVSVVHRKTAMEQRGWKGFSSNDL